ncbi:MAG: hypothetical protein ABIH23_26410 [bacterium]
MKIYRAAYCFRDYKDPRLWYCGEATSEKKSRQLAERKREHYVSIRTEAGNKP